MEEGWQQMRNGNLLAGGFQEHLPHIHFYLAFLLILEITSVGLACCNEGWVPVALQTGMETLSVYGKQMLR